MISFFFKKHVAAWKLKIAKIFVYKHCFCYLNVENIPRQLLLSIYHTLITPYLTYGVSAWGYCAKTHSNRLLILQKRALRLIFFCRSREHAIPLFIKSNCLPISFLFFQQLCYLMYDIHTQVAPINLINQFTKMHNYNTRSSSNECFTVKTSRTGKMKKSFTRLAFQFGIRSHYH